MKIPITSERTDFILVSFQHNLRRDGEGPHPHTLALIKWTDKGDGSLAAFTGLARVHPNDQPERKVGRKIALARALKIAGLSKEERTQVWRGLAEKGMRLG